MTPANLHPQVQVDYHGRAIRVDEGIAELLQMVWRAGIKTSYSCQGGSEPGEISVAGVAGASMFGRDASDADIVFPTFEDGVDFLHETVLLLGPPTDFFSPLHYDDIVLKALPPLPNATTMRAKASWAHDLTPVITGAWRDR